METNLQVFEIDSYVRGYHAYTDVWSPVIGETLLVKREPSNVKNRHAVAIFKEDAVVGHVPYNIAPRFSQFLSKERC